MTLLMRDRSPGMNRIIVEHNLHQDYFDCDAVQVNSVPNPEAITALMVTLKAHQTLEALHSMANILPRYRAIVLMQNGMGVLEQIRHEYSGLPLLVGITNQGAYRLGKLHIVQAGRGETWLGCPRDQPVQIGPEAVADLLQISPGPVQWDSDILSRQWIKLAVNCVINGLTVIENCRNGQLAQSVYRARITRLCAEIDAVLSHYVKTHKKFSLRREVLRVAESTSENYSSMLQDVQNGRTTEVDYLNGYLCRQAAVANIPVPENNTLFAEIRAMVAV